MRNLFPFLLFLGLLGGGFLLQHEASAKRNALEESLGGPRVGVPLQTCAEFQRMMHGEDSLPANWRDQRRAPDLDAALGIEPLAATPREDLDAPQAGEEPVPQESAGSAQSASPRR